MQDQGRRICISRRHAACSSTLTDKSAQGGGPMISKILVPIDGSKASHKAAKFAIELAKQTGASLTLLSVIDKRFLVEQSVSASASPTHLKESVEDYLKQSAQASTEEIAKACERMHIQCKAAIKTGHPVEEIVSEAAKSRADLIV